MAKKTDKRSLVTLSCSECKAPNYRVSKNSDNSNNSKDKLNLNKYCKHCRRTTKHVETKTK